MNDSNPTITPIELANLAARFSYLPPERAAEKAMAFYKAACAQLAPVPLDRYKKQKNQANSFSEFLAFLFPEKDREYLRNNVIEWRFNTLSENESRRANGNLFTHEDVKAQVALWEQGIGWKSLTNWGDFKKFVLEIEEMEKVLEKTVIAVQKEKAHQARLENVDKTNQKKRKNLWLKIAKNGGNLKNRRHQEFLETIRKCGSNAGSALNNMRIYLSQETIDQCVVAVKELDQKKVRTTPLTSKIASKRRN